MKKIKSFLVGLLICVFASTALVGCGKKETENVLSNEEIAYSKLDLLKSKLEGAKSDYYVDYLNENNISGETISDSGRICVSNNRTHSGNLITRVNVSSQQYYELHNYNSFSVLYNYYNAQFQKYYNVSTYKHESESFDGVFEIMVVDRNLIRKVIKTYENAKENSNLISLSISSEDIEDNIKLKTKELTLQGYVESVIELMVKNDKLVYVKATKMFENEVLSINKIRYDYEDVYFEEIKKSEYMLNDFDLEEFIDPIEFGEINYMIDSKVLQNKMSGEFINQEVRKTYLNIDADVEHLALVDNRNNYKEYYQTTKFATQYSRKDFHINENNYTKEFITEDEYNNQGLMYNVNSVFDVATSWVNKATNLIRTDLDVSVDSENYVNIRISYEYKHNGITEDISSGEILLRVKDSRVIEMEIKDIDCNKDIVTTSSYIYTYGISNNIDKTDFNGYVFKTN